MILADVDPRSDRLEHDHQVLYCGMTRAAVPLEMLLRSDNPENAIFLEHAS